MEVRGLEDMGAVLPFFDLIVEKNRNTALKLRIKQHTMPIFDTAYQPKIRSSACLSSQNRKRRAACVAATKIIGGMSLQHNAAGPSPTLRASSPITEELRMQRPFPPACLSGTTAAGGPTVTRSAVKKPSSAIPSPARRTNGAGSAVSSPRRGGGNGGREARMPAPNIEVSGLMRCVRAAQRRRAQSLPSSTSSSDESDDADDDDDDDEAEDAIAEGIAMGAMNAIQEALGEESDDDVNDTSMDSDASTQRRQRQIRRRSRRASPSDTFPAQYGKRTEDDTHSIASTTSSRVVAKAAGKKHAPPTGLRAMSTALLEAARRRSAFSPRQTPILLKPARGAVRMTVVLDLDETLVRLRDGRTYVRPHATTLFETLKRISGVEIVIWTCATDRYARDALQKIRSATWNHIVSRDPRWYRDDQPGVKNMAWLGRDLDRCIMVDNCPVAVSANPDNCIVVQDIPECLPAVDDTLRIVAEIIAHVVASGLSVSEALNKNPLVSTVGFQISSDSDTNSEVIDVTVDDMGVSTPTSISSPQFLPSDGVVDSAGELSAIVTPTDGGVATATGRAGKAMDFPSVIIARCLKYSIPSVVATFGSLEQPAHRLGVGH